MDLSRARLLLGTALLSLTLLGAARAQDSTATPPQGPAAAPPDTTQKAGEETSDKKMRALLDSMVKALGGDKWLNLPGYLLNGRSSSYYKGRPTGGTSLFSQYHAYPDKDRIEYGKKHDVVDILVGNEGWDVTYKGKTPIPEKDLEDFIRRRNHSIEIAVRVWLKDPQTLLIDGGQTTVDRTLVDRVTLLSRDNDNITLDLDAQTHLPVRRTFEWRDPLYKDKNVDAEAYALYHNIDRIETPFTVTRYHNDDQTNQRNLDDGQGGHIGAVYGGAVPAEMFNVDLAASKLHKR